MSIERRSLLRGAAVAVGGAAIGGAGVGIGTASAQPTAQAVDFHGEHQAGILTPRQPAAAYVALDVMAESRADLIAVMRELTAHARTLATGGRPPNLGITAPPADSGVVGPVVPPGRLTVTTGLGSSFYDRFDLAAHKPRRLRPMESFPDDRLDPAQCHGDVLIQVCADDADLVHHGLRDLLRGVRGGLAPRWRVNGFIGPPRPTGVPRNLFGFNDGIANPAPAESDALVWAAADEPASAAGGSYFVLRTIRMLVEFWDRVTITEQERMIGRRRDTGAPLSGDGASDLPDYRNDPVGATTPLDAHIRMANPRTAATDSSRFLRRGYNYDRGLDTNGNLDVGLLFACFQQDLDRGFVAVQERLVGEPMVDYIVPVGGGYFFALPGVRDSRDWYGRALLS